MKPVCSLFAGKFDVNSPYRVTIPTFKDFAAQAPQAICEVTSTLRTGVPGGSSWGVALCHPAYNPFAYHLGSVWPASNSVTGFGLKRYGFNAHLHRLATAIFDAAELFDFDRLPEVFGGSPRDRRHPHPGTYPDTNWPQAWSAGAVILLVQSMLGLVPVAPRQILIVDPDLPEWSPELTLAKSEHPRTSFRRATNTQPMKVTLLAQMHRAMDRRAIWDAHLTLVPRLTAIRTARFIPSDTGSGYGSPAYDSGDRASEDSSPEVGYGTEPCG